MFFLRHEYLNTYVQRDREEREGNCLPSTANKERRKRKMTTTAKKRERERRSCTRTHTHTHIKNGTRDEVREKWWLNNEQKIHKNSLI